MRKTIEQYKEEIRATKGMSIPSPMMPQDKQFNNFFYLAIEKVLPDILDSVLKDLSTNKEFMAHVAGIMLDKVNIPPGKAGYTPRKGIDYDDGQPGEDYVLTDIDKLEIASKIKVPIVEKVIETIKVLQPIDNTVIQKIENEETGAEIVAKVNALEIKPELQIDAKHIKNLHVRQGTELGGSGGIARGGLKLIWNTKLSGLVNGLNAVFTVPAGLPDPKDDKFIVSVRGVLKTADAGDFTVSNNNRTITLVGAAPNGSDSPRIILYHGK